jgi:DNA polymerase
VKLFLDTETYSEVPLHAGLAKYATQAEVMIVTWAVDEGDVHCWDATHHAEIPPALLIAAEQCDQVIAHNSQFDRTIAGVDKRFPKLARLLAGKWYCTMGQALRHGLPGGLDKLCTIFKIDAKQAKIDGKKYIHLFCKPNKDGTRNTRLTHPQEWREFLKYATLDISAMREVHRKLPRWNDTAHELALWDLDQTINARGIGVDVEFATAAVRATKAEQKRLADRTKLVANGGDENGEFELRPTQRDRLLAFLLVEHGVTLPDLKADTIERRLEDPELPEYVKELLRMRQSASKSSTSKYRRLLEQQVAGRLYFLLQ